LLLQKLFLAFISLGHQNLQLNQHLLAILLIMALAIFMLTCHILTQLAL